MNESYCSETEAAIADLPLPAPIDRCPSCECSESTAFFRIDNVPALCHAVPIAASPARNVARADVKLHVCDNCRLVFNAAFDEQPVNYDDALSYDNAQHFSPRFRQFLKTTAERLCKRFDLRGKTILEIGCGDGFFLDLLCQSGNNAGVAVEPNWNEAKRADVESDIAVYTDWESLPQPHGFADFVVARHVLEHVIDPTGFLTRAREALRSDEGAIYLEVPDSSFLLREFSPWDVLYEHCLYFTPRSLSLLLSKCGLAPTELRSDFDGQMLVAEAKPATTHSLPSQALAADEHDKSMATFQSRFDSLCVHWNARLEDWHRQGKRIALWGAGTKGAMFLNTVAASDRIAVLFDVNPRKHGRVIAGTGHPIVNPESLTDQRPDVILVMNRAYESEIRADVARVCPNCQVILVSENRLT